MKVKAVISYDGSKFFGFQKQKNTPNTIVTQIELVLNSLNIYSKIKGSGRTDRGVHAIGQVIDFTLPPFWQQKSLEELKNRLNSKLKYIKFSKINIVDNSFDAQFSAKIRVYRYIIKTTPTSVFEQDFITYQNIENFNLFKDAIVAFVGKHNFKYFKKEGSITSSDIREIYKAKVFKLKDYIFIYFYADGYLRSQVRLMISAAIAVANRQISLNDLKEQIEAKAKYITKPAPPNGLYLFKVIY